MATAYKMLGQVVSGAARSPIAISNKALTSNIATLTTTAVHGLAVGDVIEVAGVDSTFDGVRVVATVPTTTTFTYAVTAANVTSVAVSPAAPAWRNHNNGGVAASNKLAVNGLVTITTSSAHGLSPKDWVHVNVGDTTVDGLRQVWAVPTTTTLCFKVSGASIATASCSGAVGKASNGWTTLFGPVTSISEVLSTITVQNGHEYASHVRVAIAATATPTVAERIVHDSAVAPNDTLSLTLGLAAQTGKYIVVQSNQPEVVFSASTAETS